MTPPARYRVFLSAVTSEFAAARDAVAADLRSRGIEVMFQRDFRQERGDTTLRKLHDYIRNCTAVVCVVGKRSGSVPPPAAVDAYAELIPEGLGTPSYTQWELLFARRYRKTLYVYLASDDYPPDRPPGARDADDPELQNRFVAWCKSQGLDRTYFAAADRLRVEVLKQDWPREISSKPIALPYPSLGKLFKGRDALLETLHRRLTAAGDREATAIVGKALHGLGGVGKTRLAVEYARRHVDDYSALLFVSGETPQLLNQQLAALAGPEVLNLPQQAAPEEDVRRAATLGWLNANPGWLLILDNLDTPEAAAAAEELLGRLAGGTVLLTSRRTQWSGAIEPIELDVLDLADAASFLLERTERNRRKLPGDEEHAAALAAELDGLALALEQAGAYVEERRQSLEDYLEEWRSHEPRVLEWHDEQLTKYPRSVWVTWETTLTQLGVAERALLRLFAWLAPDPVPLFVLESDGVEEIRAEAAELLRREFPDLAPGAGDDAFGALATLANFSMLRWDTEAQSVEVHRVVQEVLRSRIEEETRSEWLRLALRLLESAHPGNPQDVRSWPGWDALRPHVAAATAEADRRRLGRHAAALMGELGLLLLNQALFAEAEPLLRRALSIDESSYGEAHPTVAIRLNNLAQLLQETNRLSEAEPLMRRALSIDESSYGEAHPSVAIRLSNLAALLHATNRLSEAEPLMRRALSIDESSYGEAHPRVAIQLNNLAQLLQETNRLSEAEPLMRRALSIDESSYGEGHPQVAIDLNNLAQLLQDTNRLSEAEPLMRRALSIDESSYGEVHPLVAIRLNNLALLLHATNRLSEAEPLMRRALSIDESSYGEAHPMMAIDLNNLARLLQATNRLSEAEPLSRRHLAIFVAFTRETGHEHPHLRAAVGNYSRLLAQMGRDPTEIRAALEALGVDEELLPDSPSTK